MPVPLAAPLSHTHLAPTDPGHKIPAIENLGVTKDQLDSLDLTDNAITSVSNFPLLRRLSQILLANNPVRTVSPSIATSLPNLRTLILTNSAVPKDSLAVLGDTLGKCRKLEMLSLKGAPVAQADHYKDWIVFKCEKLRSLDFERVQLKVRRGFPSFASRAFELNEMPTLLQDREHARSLFLTSSGDPTPLHTSFLSAVATGSAAPSLVPKTFEPGVEPASVEKGAAGKAGRLLTKEEKERVRKAIEGAESVEEVSRGPEQPHRRACHSRAAPLYAENSNRLTMPPLRRSAASNACLHKASCASSAPITHNLRADPVFRPTARRRRICGTSTDKIPEQQTGTRCRSSQSGRNVLVVYFRCLRLSRGILRESRGTNECALSPWKRCRCRSTCLHSLVLIASPLTARMLRSLARSAAERVQKVSVELSQHASTAAQPSRPPRPAAEPPSKTPRRRAKYDALKELPPAPWRLAVRTCSSRPTGPC